MALCPQRSGIEIRLRHFRITDLNTDDRPSMWPPPKATNFTVAKRTRPRYCTCSAPSSCPVLLHLQFFFLLSLQFFFLLSLQFFFLLSLQFFFLLSLQFFFLLSLESSDKRLFYSLPGLGHLIVLQPNKEAGSDSQSQVCLGSPQESVASHWARSKTSPSAGHGIPGSLGPNRQPRLRGKPSPDHLRVDRLFGAAVEWYGPLYRWVGYSSETKPGMKSPKDWALTSDREGFWDDIAGCFNLSLPRVININFPLQHHQKSSNY